VFIKLNTFSTKFVVLFLIRPVSNESNQEKITVAGSAGSRCVMKLEVRVILLPDLPRPQQNSISVIRVLKSVLGIQGTIAAIQAATSQNFVLPY
jgi:hypothetical protein